MTKKLVVLALVAVMTANVNVSANKAVTQAEVTQAVTEINNIVTEAKKAGLTEEQAVAAVAAELEAKASTMTTKQKRALYLGLGVVAVAGVTFGLWWTGTCPFGGKAPVEAPVDPVAPEAPAAPEAPEAP